MKLVALVALVFAVAAPVSSALAGGFITDTLAPGGGNHRAAPARGYRIITDTLAPGGGMTTVTSARVPTFNWADAGIGAGIAAGALLALLGGVLVVGRRHLRIAV